MGRKLNRTWAHRESMFKTMVTQLIKHDAINTTLPKAKELRKLADHMTTLAKKGTLHARRQARSIVREEVCTPHPNVVPMIWCGIRRVSCPGAPGHLS